MLELGSVRWGDMLFSLLMFIILFLLLRKYAFGPLMNVMEKRANQIEKDLEEAKRNRAEAEKLLAEQRANLEQAKKDAKTILENARNTSEKQAEEIIRAAKAEVDQYKSVARKEIEREKEKAVEALRKEMGQLSVLLASKVIEKELDPKQQQQLIDDFLKEVGTKKWVQ
ncbi:ATP synthase F0, B subunit [Caldalkalibacillus thermarum TA2.A1]|uniref:ATP synthase subunit b n=2 Tax=Bacillaceae TaxID=186817 RepID=F5LA76_CALTT|nr:F0F1 ATP synthase subunit B [Caldalkalibacillus thermarum]AAQ10086.1 ATP synthase subunit b [Bacillus sp. TA2.A1]EGL81796.1 ATP synthase F0, B subunit [Caldalkalibacillus thermarum TA2.A1]GGK25784.1 ATP synthase subunit b [Caldalkalibacillus thermarum]